ncbi:MAG: CvpA family protein [Verrucomicrobiota bacterium]
MSPELPASDGSMLWQLLFVSFAVVLILFEFIRGWRFGLMRQLVRLLAVVAAYAAAIFGGKLLLPVARPFLRMPDSVTVMLAGAVLALLIYSVVMSLGIIFFKRTDQQESQPRRFFYGASGALVGMVFGAFLVWLVVVGVRSLGSIADGQVHAQAEAQPVDEPLQGVHTVLSSTPGVSEEKEEHIPLMTLLARLKNSIELGPVGDVVKRTDPVPHQTYETLGKIGQLLAKPETADRFLAFPGARELSENPKITALRNDPEIAELIAHGRLFDLLQNEKILDAANDADLVGEIKKFDLRRALDYALSK